MLGAGRRDRRIVFERAAVTTDDYGSEVATWSELCSPFAVVTFGTSAERRQAAVEGASQSATFRVLATTATRAVTFMDRIAFAGSAWDIEGIAPIGRTEIEFTAVRAAPLPVSVPDPDGGGELDFSSADNSALLALFDFAAAPSGEGGQLDFSTADHSGLMAVL